MSRTVISSPDAPPAIGPYSQGILTGGLVFTSGQIPVDPKSGGIPQGVEAQARQALENLKNVLEAAGSGLEKVVKTTVFIKSMDDFAKINAVYETFFGKPYPARTCVEVARLPKDVLVEVEAIAAD